MPPDHQDCKSRQVERHYPALLRERGIEGRVLVRVKVDEDGRAAEVLVQGASGWRLLDEAALQVAAACAYQPARRGEQRLMAWIEYPIRFTLH
ncbi:MAG TPA: energy transducer TonB [Burkholderiaceae bacterium]|nr:energy transducer TonB [Burkholderiaceae bacterium]